MSASTPDYRFARSPKWILSHLLVVIALVAMIAAGFWQLDRHFQRHDRNDLIEARAQLEPVRFDAVAPPGTAASIGDEQQYLRVEVTGVYQIDDEVLVRNRTLDGAPGWWVLTPLLTDDGWAVAVNRGWIPLSFAADASRPGTEPPQGRVTIVGVVEPSRQAEGFQRADPATGRLTSLARPDVSRLAQQVEYPMSPVVVQIDPDSAPPRPADGLPAPIPPPALDAGPHLSYAAQWFIFATIAVVGYPLILRRLGRGQGSSYDFLEDPPRADPHHLRREDTDRSPVRQ